ncbi:hypothetical protein C8F01DRAFT_448130 [Mycena amicta]|nr:hypothetical protein C8F01DRAFT_448130 [Mycena amicta]
MRCKAEKPKETEPGGHICHTPDTRSAALEISILAHPAVLDTHTDNAIGNELDGLRGHGAFNARASLALSCIALQVAYTSFDTRYRRSPRPSPRRRHNDGWHSLATSITEQRQAKDQGVGGYGLVGSERNGRVGISRCACIDALSHCLTTSSCTFSSRSLLEIGRHDSAPSKHVPLDRDFASYTRPEYVGIRAGNGEDGPRLHRKSPRLPLRILPASYSVSTLGTAGYASDDTTLPLKDG